MLYSLQSQYFVENYMLIFKVYFFAAVCAFLVFSYNLSVLTIFERVCAKNRQ